MKIEQFQREKSYYAQLSIARQLQKQSLITSAEYKKVEEDLVKKYCPMIDSLIVHSNPPQK